MLRRWFRRTLAPLLAGALAATGLIAVARADVLPRGTPHPQTDAPDAPELDLRDVLARDFRFDLDTLFPDLEPVGEFPGLYAYGDRRRVAVGEELELLSDRAFARRTAEVATPREAASRYLLGPRCNAAQALMIREQVSRPIRATIVRPHEELIAKINDFLGREALPPGVAPATIDEMRAALGDDLRFRAAPLVSEVEIGKVTVSVVDTDLLRARPPTLVQRLLRTDAFVSATLGTTSLRGALDDPAALYSALVRSCLHATSVPGTSLDTVSLRGHAVWTATLARPADRAFDTLHSRDVVTWIEEPDLDGILLEVRVEAFFDRAVDNLRLNRAVDLPTDLWLQLLANTVEPALEVASVIVGRELDALELLEREAFARIPGREYGEGIAGTDAAVRTALRQGSESIDPMFLQEQLGEAVGLEARVRSAAARPVFERGAIGRNIRRKFSTPPDPSRVLPAAVVQVVFWDPTFLNSDRFRSGWERGIRNHSAEATSIGQVVRELVAEEEFVDEVLGPRLVGVVDHIVRQRLLSELGVLDVVVAERDGIGRVHFVAPCYTATVTGFDLDTALRTAESVVDAQRSERTAIFGAVVEPPIGPTTAISDTALDLRFRPALFERRRDLVAIEERIRELISRLGPEIADLVLDHQVAREKSAIEHIEELEAQLREERDLQDQVRTARCSRANLQAYLSGAQVEDIDRNGIADHLPENDAVRELLEAHDAS